MAKEKRIVAMTFQVTAITFAIKILGVLKQSIIAAVCGASLETDAYFIASGIIVALCSVIFSAVSVSFLSIYTERCVHEGMESGNNLVNAVLRFFLPIAIFIMIIFFVFSTQFAKAFAPSYDGEQLRVLAGYIRIMSVMFLFSCYTLIINVVLEADKRFLPGRMQNLLQNAFIIVAALLFYKQFGIGALLYAFLLAGVVQCILITISARNVFKFQLKISPEKEKLKQLIVLIIPLLLGNAIYEINDIVDKQISSGIGSGSVSYLSYGASINEIVSALIITSVSSVLFSHYATWVAEGEINKIESTLKKSLELLIMLIMPIMVMYIVGGDCIVALLYGRGSFGIESIQKTYSVVIGYALGFFFQAARSIIIRVFYAFQDAKTPMVNGLVAIIANIFMSIVFSKVFGVGGIALATSVAMLLVSLLLLPCIKKYIAGFSLKESIPEYIKVIIAGVITGVISYLVRMVFQPGYIFGFFFLGVVVVSIYCLAAYCLGIKSFKSSILQIKKVMRKII
ncbi:murein biosynthesis integral membrane protein MurJ [Sporofaciens sp. SGI.106]|uniref:murein biosynthesis integral membrane protein MurJ n=1 Tax=Sporofaciens sp. SGI.106 TaxID=3420568 RepID=UPI003CFDAF60